MLRSTKVIIVLVIIFFGFKILRFQTLAYTFHDMYCFLQTSTSWMDGRPFMYDNFFGYHQRIHNYYTLVLWGPIVYKFGAYGLFFVQAVLLLLAYVLVNQRLAKTDIHSWLRYGLLAVVLIGPTTLWLNDHTSMGWHTELTYFPFGLLFALSLMGKGRVWSIIAGLGIILVKEDGAVLAALIHLGYFSVTYLRKHPNRSLWYLLAERHFWFIALGWSVVFLAGLLWLNQLNDAAEPRLQVALTSLTDNIGKQIFWLRIGREIGATLLLLLAPVGYLGMISQQLASPLRNRLFVLYGLGIAALSAMNLIQSFYYYTKSYLPVYHLFGLTWPPRFALLWAFTAAFLTTILILIPLERRSERMKLIWVLLGVLVVMQLPILRIARPDMTGVAETSALMMGRASPFKDSYYLNPEDLDEIKCIAEHLPARSNVLALNYVWPYFHKHYIVGDADFNFKPADVALIPITTQKEQQKKWATKINKSMRKPYRIVKLHSYYLYIAKGYEDIPLPCIRQKVPL